MLNARSSKSQDSSRTVDQREFNAAVAAHEKFARGTGGARVILRFVDASNIDCQRRILNDADFTGSNLSGSLLAGCHLERASLHCADLRGCDLRASNLRRADLRGACLAGASLNGAVLDGADMRAAYIALADGAGGLQVLPRRTVPVGGRNGADPNGVDFTNCAMRGVALRDSNLKGANFSGAVLDGADLEGAKLTGAVFHGAVLTGIPVAHLPLSSEQLKTCVLDPTTDAFARLPALTAALQRSVEWVESGGKRGGPAVLDNEDLRPLRGAFQERQLTALSARNARGVRMDFSGSELQGAVFDGADLRCAVFDRADLRGASFRNAKLSHVSFNHANLSPLTLPDGREHPPCFDGATLERADFSNTVLEIAEI